MSTEEFVIPNMGHTMGNLICVYLSINPIVLHAGYRVDPHIKSLVIKICVKENVEPSQALTDSINACKDDINQLTASWVKQITK